jgi:magnesium transporter
MITSFHRRPDGSVARDVSFDVMREALASAEGLLWVDLEEATPEEGTLLKDVFRFHQLAIDDCYNGRVDPAKIDDYGDHIFIVAQAIRYVARTEQLRTTEVDLFIGKNYVVSFHEFALPFVDDLRRRCENDGPELTRGPDMMAHALLDRLVDEYLPAVEELDKTLDDLEESALSQPQSDFLSQILLLKRNVQGLRRTIIPQRDVINRIVRGEFPHVIREESLVYFRDIYDHVVRVEQLVESVRDLADGVLSTYLSSVNNRMNEVMKTFAVITGVFLPLTLIASIYGMNFENMPELEWEYGYFIILAVMASVGIGLAVFFRLRKWW